MRFDLEFTKLDDIDTQPTQASRGTPMVIPLDHIEEDPQQPRRHFDEDSLKELATTISQRGVRQPVSVRRHPSKPDQWILNFGARRLRASRLAGKADVPAFVDETSDRYDQLNENLQRADLDPHELALWVKDRIEAGDSQAEIARRLGKSRQYVTLATALIDPPAWILSAFTERKCRGLNELYELRKLYEAAPGLVQSWAAQRLTISREGLQELKVAIAAADTSQTSVAEVPASAIGDAGQGQSNSGASRTNLTESRNPRPSKRLRQQQPIIAPTNSTAASVPPPRLQAQLGEERVAIVTDDVPTDPADVFVTPLVGDARRAVRASTLKLICFARP